MAEKIILALIAGLFGGGLAFLAARSKTKTDAKVALAKVDADHETEGRSVAIQEIEASLLRLAAENTDLRAKHEKEMAAAVARISALEQEQKRLHDSERQCHNDLAFLRGKIAVLEGQTPTSLSAAVALAAQPKE